MGQSQLIKSKTFKELKLNDFKFLKLIGKGSVGKVYLAKMESTNKFYAIKSIRKDVILERE